MNKSLKQAAIALLNLPVVGSLALSLLSKLGKQEAILKYKRIKAEQKLLSKPGFDVIQSGIFKGMRYPVADAAGSYLAPKIVGSYEKELYPFIKRLITQKAYSVAFDIGCAEGYYAVGLTTLVPGLKMYAFDTDEVAISLCKKIAEANEVAQRIEFGGFCTPEYLAAFPFPNPSLIICDCEGYEATLFSKNNIGNLQNVDVLIELHEHMVPGVKQQLIQLFRKTHKLTIIAEMPKNGDEYPFLSFLTPEERKLVVSEGRRGVLGPPSMEWLLAESVITAENQSSDES